MLGLWSASGMNYVETQKAEVLLKIPVPQRETQESCHWWRKVRAGLGKEWGSAGIKGRVMCVL